MSTCGINQPGRQEECEWVPDWIDPNNCECPHDGYSSNDGCFKYTQVVGDKCIIKIGKSLTPEKNKDHPEFGSEKPNPTWEVGPLCSWFSSIPKPGTALQDDNGTWNVQVDGNSSNPVKTICVNSDNQLTAAFGLLDQEQLIFEDKKTQEVVAVEREVASIPVTSFGAPATAAAIKVRFELRAANTYDQEAPDPVPFDNLSSRATVRLPGGALFQAGVSRSEGDQPSLDTDPRGSEIDTAEFILPVVNGNVEFTYDLITSHVVEGGTANPAKSWPEHPNNGVTLAWISAWPVMWFGHTDCPN